MNRILVINGPNLDILGTRQPDIYGQTTLSEIQVCMEDLAAKHGAHLECFQTNYEGKAVDRLHEAKDSADVIIINPASFTPYGIAVRSALVASQLPAILVHISNIYGRNDGPERHLDVFAPVVIGQICGLGVFGYVLAFHAALRHLKQGLRNLKDL